MTDKLTEAITGALVSWWGSERVHPPFVAHLAAAIREAFKPAAYVIGWYNQPPILDDIAVFPYDTPGAAASDAARNPDGIEWRVFALHEVPVEVPATAAENGERKC